MSPSLSLLPTRSPFTTKHQEKPDLEIPINFLLISKKQEKARNHGNSQEISGNDYKFLRRLGNHSAFFLIFQC